MTPKALSPLPRNRPRPTFAERFCGRHGQPDDAYTTLAWRYGASTLTRVLRPLRRGIWRRLGMGIDEARLLKYYDHMVAMEVIENEAVRVAETEARTRSGIGPKQQIS